MVICLFEDSNQFIFMILSYLNIPRPPEPSSLLPTRGRAPQFEIQ
jgi:hypothetical protein